MRTFVVGGAIRDTLLGLPVVDRDYVVVGATVDEMVAAGFRAVGRDFPVFLHPQTHAEYALARTERKVRPGYAGFVFHADPSVTLEADLERRDLTINAMAEDEAGTLIDPFGGRDDLAARVFRHVGPAFGEDPVRLLRVARFAARFADFTIAPETLALMRRMADDGEVDALVPERVWQEIARGLMEATPSRMIGVLRDTGALARLLPEIDAAFTGPEPWSGSAMPEALDRAAAGGASLAVRFAVLVQPLSAEAAGAACERLVVPRTVRDVALLAILGRSMLLPLDAPRVVDWIGLFERGDAFRRRPRFLEAVEAIGWTMTDEGVRDGFRRTIETVLDAAAAVDAGGIARQAADRPATIAALVRDARGRAIGAALETKKAPGGAFEAGRTDQ